MPFANVRNRTKLLLARREPPFEVAIRTSNSSTFPDFLVPSSTTSGVHSLWFSLDSLRPIKALAPCLPRSDAAAAVLVRVEAPLRLSVDSDSRLDVDVVLLLPVKTRRKDLKAASSRLLLRKRRGGHYLNFPATHSEALVAAGILLVEADALRLVAGELDPQALLLRS